MTDAELDLSTNGKTPQPVDDERKQVLALSGGGFRGLYTAAFLDHAETEFNCAARDCFDLIIGTSIGSLIAAGLAVGISAQVITTKIAEHGKTIFKRIPLWTRGKQILFRAPYSSETLKDAINDTIGEHQAARSLSSIQMPLAICAVNYTHGRQEIFRSRGLAGNEASTVSIMEAVLASAAAPTYFPPRKVGDDLMIDGGLIANAPDLLGVTEAYGRLAHPLRKLYVLSVGTASRRQGAALASIGQPGSLSWLLRRRLFQMTIASQESLAEDQCRTILKSRYYRVDEEPAEQQVAAIKDLDKASDKAARTLRSLANQSWNVHRSRDEFRSFFL